MCFEANFIIVNTWHTDCYFYSVWIKLMYNMQSNVCGAHHFECYKSEPFKIYFVFLIMPEQNMWCDVAHPISKSVAKN